MQLEGGKCNILKEVRHSLWHDAQEEPVAAVVWELHKDKGQGTVKSAEWLESDGLLMFRGKIYTPKDKDQVSHCWATPHVHHWTCKHVTWQQGHTIHLLDLTKSSSDISHSRTNLSDTCEASLAVRGLYKAQANFITGCRTWRFCSWLSTIPYDCDNNGTVTTYCRKHTRWERGIKGK
jgi:hypothetical protein